MKTTSTLYFAFVSLFQSLRPKRGMVQTVSSVDLKRYMGLWYEIASYPQWYERGLTNVSALYIAKNDYVEVVNSGYKSGKLQEARGRALVVSDSGYAKLRVTFFRPFYGKYWIIDLAEDYSWAVVSNPNRTTLWILCRERMMDEMIYLSIIDRLVSRGFDTSKLVEMKQKDDEC